MTTIEEPLAGPCTPWITGDDLPCSDLDEDLRNDAAAVATNLLFRMSPTRYSGECEETVRPYRCNCRDSECCCPGLDEISLPGTPIRSIEEVKIDGEIVDAGLYDFDRATFRKLVRLADADGSRAHWPRRQRLDLPDTESDTFSVTYKYGRSATPEAIRAAKTLACEFALGWTPGKTCNLPKRVQSISRQEVSMVLIDPFDFFERGKTGIWEIDIWLTSLEKRRRPATVASPDFGPHTRRD